MSEPLNGFATSADVSSSYYDRLGRAIKAELAASHGDLQQLCRRLKGAFPADIARILGDQRATKFAVSQTAGRRSPFDLRSPEPHPIDYDWRFDEATANALARLAMDQGTVLCVGTPTIYDTIAEQGGSACLIDRNPLLYRSLFQTDRCRFIIDDIGAMLPTDSRIGGLFSAAILDPPWYPHQYELWLARTIPFIEPGGTLFLILFRELTRPDAHQERSDLLDRLATIGSLSYPDLEAVYSTPGFEAEVFSRLRLPPLQNWRAGDLVRIDLHPHVTSWPFPSRFAASDWAWHRFIVEGQVIAIADREHDDGPIEYFPPTPGNSFKLDSVSARDPRRGTISVWTSRHCAAAASGTQRIAAILGFSHHTDKVLEPTVTTSVDQDIVRRLAAELGFTL